MYIEKAPMQKTHFGFLFGIIIAFLFLSVTVTLTAQHGDMFRGILMKVVNAQGDAVGSMAPPTGYQNIQCGANVSIFYHIRTSHS